MTVCSDGTHTVGFPFLGGGVGVWGGKGLEWSSPLGACACGMEKNQVMMKQDR